METMFLETEAYVREKDVSIKDNIRPSAILDYFQDVAGIHADILKIGYEDIIKDNLLWVILYSEFNVVKRLPLFGEKIKIQTWPKIKGKLEFHREFQILDSNNELLVTGISIFCLINTETRRLERASKVEYIGSYYEKSNYPEKIDRKLLFNIDNVLKEYNYKVLLTDCDHNLHLNNAKYLDIIYNMQALDLTKKIKKVRINFLHEALIDEVIKVKYVKNEYGSDCFIGYVNDNECFTAIYEME